MSRADSADKKNNETTCRTCTSKTCSAQARRHDESDEDFADRQKLQSRLCRIKHKMVVLSGKGGVGKSTVSVNLATALSMAGYRVGLLDIDIHGPSVPTMLGIASRSVEADHDGLLPIEINGLKVMSIGFLLENQDEAVIWRGPRKMGVIRQFLRDVAWGDLDYLIVDSPPGTGDEPLSICQLLDTLDGAVIVTTPQKVASVDVRKSITFCNTLHVPVLGVIENMSGFVCPTCGTVTQILPSGGGRTLAESMHVPFLGSIPMDPGVALCGDNGQAFVSQNASSATAAIMQDIVKPLLEAGKRKAAS
jgi:Mrp family chromosome partitioning ATPase